MFQILPNLKTTMAEKFNLSWKDYQSNVIKSFSSLRNEDNLNDVTLVSDDHVQIFAHKVVLSSSSGYFKDIFIKNRQPHPILCLVGVNSQEVNNVLDYIYKGEVQISQNNLNTFLEVAQKFELEGLVGLDNEINTDDSKSKILEAEIQSLSYASEGVSHKKEMIQIGDPSEATLVSEMFSNIDELDSTIDNEIFKNSDGFWQCRRCPKFSSKRCHIKEHFETHITGISFPCQYCDKICRSRKNLRDHQYQKA